ncbi:hypothetical protein CVT26_011297, partial [Gymnopilus dilepis]
MDRRPFLSENRPDPPILCSVCGSAGISEEFVGPGCDMNLCWMDLGKEESILLQMVELPSKPGFGPLWVRRFEADIVKLALSFYGVKEMLHTSDVRTIVDSVRGQAKEKFPAMTFWMRRSPLSIPNFYHLLLDTSTVCEVHWNELSPQGFSDFSRSYVDGKFTLPVATRIYSTDENLPPVIDLMSMEIS